MKQALKHVAAAIVALFLGLGLGVPSASAQQVVCEDTREGRICRVTQEIQAGVEVNPETQRLLGLVTVVSPGGTCSGTLLNRHWVLTARHCVAFPPVPPPPVTAPWQGALRPVETISVTAAPWAPGRIGRPSAFYEFAANSMPGTLAPFDIILVYLGLADLGPVNSQVIYEVGLTPTGSPVQNSLKATDLVTQYGQGFSTFATGSFPAPPGTPVSAMGLGTYRSAQFTPTSITQFGYMLNMNANNQVGHGGDSGGPSVVTVNGLGIGIAGVQSTCARDTSLGVNGFVPNAPVPAGAPNPGWLWTMGITGCTYVATTPFWREIYRTVARSPDCTASGGPSGPSCLVPPIIRAALPVSR